jgi:hypothetical protein
VGHITNVQQEIKRLGWDDQFHDTHLFVHMLDIYDFLDDYTKGLKIQILSVRGYEYEDDGNECDEDSCFEEFRNWQRKTGGRGEFVIPYQSINHSS